MNSYRLIRLATCLSLLAGGSRALDINWTNTVDGDFSVEANWSPNQVPGSADKAVFNREAAATTTVTVDAPLTNVSLLVQTDKVLLDLSGGPYALSDKLSVESGTGSSELTITGGVLRMYGNLKPLYAGESLNKTGTVVVCGPNTVVDMLNCQYLAPGYNGVGFLYVTNGAVIKNWEYLGLGRSHASSYGSLYIDHAVVSNDQKNATIGEAGGAMIMVTNGGHLHIKGTWAAHRGTITATGEGSRISSGNYLSIGAGTLIVTNGGTLAPSTSYIGYGGSYAKTGTVVVAGQGSLFRVNGNFMLGGHANVGTGGVGLMTVADGGRAEFNTAAGTSYAWSNAIVTLDGGVLYGRNGADFHFHPLSLLRGRGVFDRADIFNSGVCAPGLPTGTLVVSNANYTQVRTGYPAGRLELTLAGRGEGDYSRLAVPDGTMTLAGTCAVRLAESFKPAIGDTFRVLEWKTLAAGRFDTLELPALSHGKSWVTNDLYVGGTLAVDGQRGSALLVR